MFLKYLLRNNIGNKLYILGFFIAMVSYSAWQPIEDVLEFTKENEGKLFFIGIAFSFCCYTSAYMFTRWNKWRWFPMIVFFICLSRLIKELLYIAYPEDDPTKYDVLDYINGLVTLWIVFNYYIKYQHKKFKGGGSSS